MDIYKQKYTKLQQEIVRFLFANLGRNFNQRTIAIKLKVSPTAVKKSITLLKKDKLIRVGFDRVSNSSEISLNLDNEKIFYYKKLENLRLIYESGLKDFLEQKFLGKTVVLFGSFSRGEDTFESDIDIAIIGQKEKEVDLKDFEKIFSKKINIQFYDSIEKIHKNLKENLFNGIVLSGGFKL